MRIALALLLIAPVAHRRDDEYRELKGHEGPPRVCLFSSDGKTLISASGWPAGDRTVRVWDVASGKLTKTLKGHKANIDYVAITRDAKIAISGSHDKTAKVWDVAAGKELLTFKEHKKTVTSVAITSDGKTAATGDGDGRIVLWTIADGKVIREMTKAHGNEVRCLTFSPDDSLLYSGAWDGTVKVWDAKTAKVTMTIEPGNMRVDNIVLFDKGRKLIIACDQCYLWDTAKNERLRTYGEGGSICAAVSPDAKTLMTGWYDGKMRRWKLETGELVEEFQAHEAFCHWIDFSPDGKTVATSGGGSFADNKENKGKDHVVRIWKLED